MDAFMSPRWRKWAGSDDGGGGRFMDEAMFMDEAGKAVEANERTGDGGIGGSWCAWTLINSGEEAMVPELGWGRRMK